MPPDGDAADRPPRPRGRVRRGPASPGAPGRRPTRERPTRPAGRRRGVPEALAAPSRRTTGWPGPELARAVLDAALAKRPRGRPARRGRRTGRRRGQRRRLRGYSGPGPDPRDPQLFGAVLERLMKARGWEKPAGRGDGLRRLGAGGRPGHRRAQPTGEARRRRADRRGRVDRVGDPAAPARRRPAQEHRRRGRPQRGHQAARSTARPPRRGARARAGSRAAGPRDTYG